MKIFKSLFAVVMLLSMASCSDDDNPEMKSVREYYRCFNLVENAMSGTRSVYESPVYVIEQDYLAGTAAVEVRNVKFAERMQGITMRLEGLKFTTSSTGSQLVTGSEIVPLVDGQPYEQYVITSFRCEILDYGENYLPVINITYTINQAFRITAIPTLSCFYGSTQVSNAAASTEYATAAPVYKVSIDVPTMTATLDIEGAKFADMMPSMDMQFGDIPVTVNNSGYELECESLVPTIGSVPYPDYVITNLVGVVNFTSGMKLGFDCMGVFSVNADLKYSPLTSQE